MNEITKSNTETMVYRILVVRGHRVLLDRDLAECYKVATKALNQAVRRHPERFPGDFAFRLTQEEKEQLVTICDRFASLKHSTVPPLAFTEHGVVMAATVLNSSRAVAASITVLRIFVELRTVLSNDQKLARRIANLESTTSQHGQLIGELIKRMVECPRPIEKCGPYRVSWP